MSNILLTVFMYQYFHVWLDKKKKKTESSYYDRFNNLTWGKRLHKQLDVCAGSCGQMLLCVRGYFQVLQHKYKCFCILKPQRERKSKRLTETVPHVTHVLWSPFEKSVGRSVDLVTASFRLSPSAMESPQQDRKLAGHVTCKQHR